MFSRVAYGESGISNLLQADAKKIHEIHFSTDVPEANFITITVGECCVNSQCKNNFIHIKRRFLTTKDYPITYNYDVFCKDCGYPNKTTQHQDLVKDYVEDLFNLEDLRQYTDGPQSQPIQDVFCYVKTLNDSKNK